MGEMADDAMQEAMMHDAAQDAWMANREERAEQIWEHYLTNTCQWQTRELTMILVQKMTITHIEHTIALLHKKLKMNNDPVTEMWIKVFEREILKRDLNYP